MFLITYHAHPGPEVEQTDKIGGAYINSYVSCDNLVEAEEISRRWIQAKGWEIESKENETELDPDSLSDQAQNYYEQALIDGEIYVLHMYPPNQET